MRGGSGPGGRGGRLAARQGRGPRGDLARALRRAEVAGLLRVSSLIFMRIRI